MHILGLSCYFHDASAAILRDGTLIAAAEEERFSRVKHDFGFPSRAIAFCLEQAGIEGKDVDHVAFFEKPFVKFDRILQTTFAEVPKSGAVFRQAITAWMLLPSALIRLFLPSGNPFAELVWLVLVVLSLVLTWRMTNAAIGKGAAVGTAVFTGMLVVSLAVLFCLVALLGITVPTAAPA